MRRCALKAKHIFTGGLFMILGAVFSVSAQEPVYYDVVQKIMEFEFENSDVMENASWICDVFGPRFVKTPSYREACGWAKERLKEYGLANARLESYEFGNGWDIDYVSVHMVAPKYMPIIGFPAPWSSGTNGKVRAPAIHINFDEITSEADLEQYRGKLKGRILLIRPIQEISPHFEANPLTWSEERLDEMSKIRLEPRVSVLELELQRQERRRSRSREDRISRQKIVDFVFGEGAIAIVHPDGQHYYGSVAPGRYNRIERPWEYKPPQPPELVLAVEQYNRMMRILEKDIPVEMEIEIRTNFYRGDPHDFNVIAEIPGSDLAHEIVIVGGHLQSVPVGSGAIDNAAGAVTSMEAVRILKAIGVKPRRTIRVGLWGGHDGGGLAGNRGHVRKHFADPIEKEYKKDYHNFVAYFDQDIGPGRIRGVSIMGNEEIRAIFTEWIKPLHGLGMSHLFTTGMYHEAYAEVGLPGFYFYHDRQEIDDWNAHTSMDVYERLFADGMMQTAVVVATLAYHAAMRDEKLPRVAPLPW
ncbi:hypothetical protein AMJ86_05860 [bacterium SM23_57]|nr:MAG: hypothetical protein AMJ86_05860 [bacterium SM23_57]